MNRLIIVGSPRERGRSAALAELLFESCIEECPDDEVALAPVSTLSIAPCQGCDSCKALAAASALEGEGADACEPGCVDEGEALRRCIIDDDMAEIYELMDAADELIVVAPVYFAGAPAQLKALLDRLQPFFWTDARHRAKRPATLHVVGEGGDPHGFEPLVGVVRSALSCAGFALERVLDWVGRIDEDGEITAEAAEHPLAPLPGQAVAEPHPPVGKAPDRPLSETAGKPVPPKAAAAAARPLLSLASDGGAAKNAGAQGGAKGGGRADSDRGKAPAENGGQRPQKSPKRPPQGSVKSAPKRSRAQQDGAKQAHPKQNRPKQNGKRRG